MTSSTYYDILSLPRDAQAQDVKQAYRYALLTHHPDKANGTIQTQGNSITSNGSVPDGPTVDEITLAYKTLSTPSLRSAYDKELALTNSVHIAADSRPVRFHTGLETVDLDDLDYDEEKNVWARSCRCGLEKGYIVTEQELEVAENDGELVTGCRGCSLWIRVMFGVLGDEENSEEHGDGNT